MRFTSLEWVNSVHCSWWTLLSDLCFSSLCLSSAGSPFLDPRRAGVLLAMPKLTLILLCSSARGQEAFQHASWAISTILGFQVCDPVERFVSTGILCTIQWMHNVSSLNARKYQKDNFECYVRAKSQNGWDVLNLSLNLLTPQVSLHQ